MAGRKKSSKNKTKSSKKKTKNTDLATQVRKLIDSVSDSDIINFKCPIPNDDTLNTLKIPVPFVKRYSLEWFGQNLLIGVGEWGDALGQVLKEDNVDFDDENCDNYSTFPTEKQIDYRKRITEIVRKSRRITMYRKYLYASEKEKQKEYLAEWSSRDNWDDFEGVSEGDEVAEVGDEVAEVGDGAVAEEGVIWEGEDLLCCRGYTLIYGSPVADKNAVVKDLPKFIHGDEIGFYEGPFSLASWYKDHKSVELRYVPEYWNWSAYKLTRELLLIVQGLINCVLDHLIRGTPHGALNDLRNYRISQFVANHAGSKKMKFRVELINPRENAVGLTEDMDQFVLVLGKLFMDGYLDDEVLALSGMLRDALRNPNGWVALVLRDYPGLWSAEERVAFYVTLANRFDSDVLMARELHDSFLVAAQFRSGVLYSWQSRIPTGSVFDLILRHPTPQDSTNSVKYIGSDVVDMLRYIRNVLLHFHHTPGSYYMELRQVEWMISDLFRGLLLNIYCGMCMCNLFLNS